LLHRDVLALIAEFRGDDGGGLEVDGLVDGHHHAHAHELADDLAALDRHLVREVADADDVGDLDDALVRRRLRDLGAAALLARLLLLAGVEPDVAAGLTHLAPVAVVLLTTGVSAARRASAAAGCAAGAALVGDVDEAR